MLFKIRVGLNTNSAIASVNAAITKLCALVNVAVVERTDGTYRGAQINLFFESIYIFISFFYDFL